MTPNYSYLIYRNVLVDDVDSVEHHIAFRVIHIYAVAST